MTKTFSKEAWKGNLFKEVVRDKGKFVKIRTIDEKIYSPVKYELPKSSQKIQLTRKYLIYESDNMLPLRGQIIARWEFKKYDLTHKTTGFSYLSPNVEKNFNSLLDQTRINAFAKSFIIGSPDHEKVLEVSFIYIIKKITVNA